MLKTLGLHNFCNFSPGLFRVVYEEEKGVVTIYKILDWKNSLWSISCKQLQVDVFGIKSSFRQDFCRGSLR